MCPDKLPWEGLGISSVIFLPKTQDLGLIMRRHGQTRPMSGTCYIITGLTAHKCQGHGRHVKVQELFQTEETLQSKQNLILDWISDQKSTALQDMMGTTAPIMGTKLLKVLNAHCILKSGLTSLSSFLSLLMHEKKCPCF